MNNSPMSCFAEKMYNQQNQTKARVNKRYKIVFYIYAFLFLIAALYHLCGLFFPEIVIKSSQLRHAVFFAIDIAGVVLILWRPPWVVYPFGILTVQQLYSHGSRAWIWWFSMHRVDWISLIVVFLLPICLGAIWNKRRAKLSK